MRRVVCVAVLAITGALALVAPPASAQEVTPPTIECAPAAPGAAAMVQLAYIVLLRRCPEPIGAATWTESLEDGTTPARFAQAMARTPEARGVVVDDAYRTVLGRSAGAAERRSWAQWLNPRPGAIRRHDHLLAALAASPEFWTASVATSAGFVERVYDRILGRPAEPAGRNYWIDRLEAGEAPHTLMRTLARLREPLGVTVAASFGEVLGRPPTPQESADEVTRLRADGDRSGLSARLVGTVEFDDRAQDLTEGRDGLAVALGDSYASGEGNPPFHPEHGDEECHRSSAAYLEVARATSAAMPGTVELAACTGATVPDVYSDQLATLDGGDDPDLVTVTIGGNDIGFRAILTACLQVEVGTSQLNPDYSDAACDEQLDDLAPAKVAELATGLRDDEGDLLDCAGQPCTLAGLLADIDAAAPDARIVVVAYPPPLPTSNADCAGPLQWSDGTSALGGRWKLAAEYMARARDLFADLNLALRTATEDAGMTYVDPGAGFAGHDVCSADPYIYGLRITQGDLEVDSASFHPRLPGTRVMADALVAALED